MLLVQVEGGRRYELEGRVAAMVLWLVRHAERLAGCEKVAVTFDCAGQKVNAEVRERELVSAAVLR